MTPRKMVHTRPCSAVHRTGAKVGENHQDAVRPAEQFTGREGVCVLKRKGVRCRKNERKLPCWKGLAYVKVQSRIRRETFSGGGAFLSLGAGTARVRGGKRFSVSQNEPSALGKGRTQNKE